MASRTTPSSVASIDASSACVTCGALGHRERQHELRRVQHLDREAAADLDLRRILRDRTPRPCPAGWRPTSSAPRRSRAAARMSAGVTTLPFDFDIFLRSGSTMKPEIAASVHGARSVLERAAQHRREQPGADDVLALRAHVERRDEVPELLVALPAAGELRRQRRRRPRVEDVALAVESAGNAALRLRVVRWARRWSGRSAADRRSGRARGRSRARRSRRGRTRPGSARRRSAGATRASRRSARWSSSRSARA